MDLLSGISFVTQSAWAGFASAGLIGTAGFCLSFGLAVLKVYETLRDRIRLRTTFAWTGQMGVPDTITVVNLGNRPLLVSYWTLELRGPFWKKPDDVTPERDHDHDWSFKLEPHSKHQLYLDDEDKLDVREIVVERRRLVLNLHLYDRSRPKRLKLY